MLRFEFMQRAAIRFCVAITALAATGLMSACGGDNNNGASPSAVPPPQIKTLSNRADLVSGGDTLVEVVLPSGLTATDLKVDVGGRDVSSAFALRPASGRIVGLITGLANGNNVVTAKAGGSSSTLTITNHPIGGPVFSGAQIQPWVCATPVAQAENGNTPGSNASGLTTMATDAQCDIATEFKLYYKTTAANCVASLPDPNPPSAPPANPCFKPYDPKAAPTDLAMTTTDKGLTVPYVVRVERGVINRGIFDIAVLFDPTQNWQPTAPQVQWNGKVVYTFGASTGQPRRQFRSEQTWTDDSALSRGFMVVDNSVTDSLYNSNRVMVAETLMMMKEHIVDSYGEVKFVMGNGCSGGSIQQNTAASIYPGLLDGIQPTCDYPDSQTTGMEVTDCVLLVNFYTTPDWAALMAGKSAAQIVAKKTVINGHLDQLGCHSWNNFFGNNGRPGNYIPRVVLNAAGDMAPQPGALPRNNCQLPAALVYDALTNPAGVRCGDADASIAIWGKAAGTNRAATTFDNAGIQYGYRALVAGSITPEEFVTLNEKIGGVDTDSNLTASRAVADPEALPIAYRSGIVMSGRQLAKLPIIDLRGYDEQGIHYIWRSFSERDRLDQETGSHANQVIWRYGTGLLAPAASGLTLMSFLTMDQWLTSLVASAPKATLNDERTQAQVVAAKPGAAFDFCYLSSDTTFSNKVTDQAVCDADARLVSHSSPRQVAGGARTENILKCQLKPLVSTDYGGIAFSLLQFSRLQAVFPAGVCDWTKPGVGQQTAISPLTFEAGPGGQPLGAAPGSKPM